MKTSLLSESFESFESFESLSAESTRLTEQRDRAIRTEIPVGTADRPQAPQLTNPFVALLRSILQGLGDILLPSAEPRIRCIQTRSGQVLWQVYSPNTGHYLYFETEDEVRIWLDQWFI